jgi:hypothetical protein
MSSPHPFLAAHRPKKIYLRQMAQQSSTCCLDMLDLGLS